MKEFEYAVMLAGNTNKMREFEYALMLAGNTNKNERLSIRSC